jgi:phosphatidylinositol alpha 1,6-mannosyltransferase
VDLLWRTVISVRITHVSDCFAPRTGGIETQVLGITRAQQGVGDDVRVITATKGPEFSEFPVDRLSFPVPFDLPVHPRTYREVSQLLRANPPEVVHVHAGVLSPFAWSATRAAHDLGLPTLVTIHSVWGQFARPTFKVSGSWLKWNRVAMSAVSDIAAAHMRESLGVEVDVVPNGINVGSWKSRGLLDWQARPLQLVSVLRIAPRKRTGALLGVMSGLRTRGVDAQLNIVGDGPEKSLWARRARKDDLPITFLGKLAPTELKGILSKSQIFVQPSTKESFGIAALEARTGGLAVIARKGTGTQTFITDGIDGRMCESDEAMVAAIAAWDRDRDSLRRVLKHNSEVAPKYSWSDIDQVVRAAYQRAIALAQ